MIKIAENVCAIDFCTYLPDVQALIISDLHIGFEENLAKQGVLVPRFQFKDIIERLDWVLARIPVKKAVLNGDVKHEFGTINRQEWREVTRLAEYFRAKNIEIIAVRGNHDTIFGPLARKLNIKEVKELTHKGILVAHGDYIPAQLKPIIIIGHEHPAITLREKAKSEKYKCFLKTTFKKSTVICQPSFNPLTQGTDVLKEQVLSPLLVNLAKSEVFVVNDKTHEVLPFGKLSKINVVK